jgi:hypothetical protein
VGPHGLPVKVVTTARLSERPVHEGLLSIFRKSEETQSREDTWGNGGGDNDVITINEEVYARDGLYTFTFHTHSADSQEQQGFELECVSVTHRTELFNTNPLSRRETK